MLENRKVVKRWDLLLFLPVHRVDNGGQFGHIADITTEGIMVFSQEPYPLYETYELQIAYEELENALLSRGLPHSAIRFQAQTRWSDSKGSLCRTGLMFLDLPHDTHKLVRTLVRNVARSFG